jgi:hypothetical protein
VKVKDKLSKIGHKTEKIQTNAGGERFYHSGLSPQSEPDAVVEGEFRVGNIEDDPQPDHSRPVSRLAVGIGHDQGGSDDKASGGETGQDRLYLHPHVQAESGSGQGRKDVDGRQVDQADPSPKPDIENETTPTPSISRGGESKST